MNRLYLIISSALAFFCVILVASLFRSCDKNYDLSNRIKLEKAETKEWKDKYGREHSRAETAELSQEAIKDLVTAGDDRFDKLSDEFKGLKKNLKNLRHSSSVVSRSETTFRTGLVDTVVVVDKVTKDAKKIEYINENGYTEFHGFIIDDSIEGKCVTKDTVNMVVYWKRTGFLGLGKKEYKTEVMSRNPDNKIKVKDPVFIKEKRKFPWIF